MIDKNETKPWKCFTLKPLRFFLVVRQRHDKWGALNTPLGDTP